jgi:crotonobetainyl-CoA:carnitine CoA-transferase CaiB-like acyl-CoA transferase
MQALAAITVFTLEHAIAAPFATLLPPGSWDGDPRLDAVPALGRHTEAILAELGMDAAAVADLRAAVAI